MKKLFALFSLLTITAVASYAGSACCLATAGKAADKKAPEQTVATVEQAPAACPAGAEMTEKAKVAMAKSKADCKGCCKDDKGCGDSGKATSAEKSTTADAGSACCAGGNLAETAKDEKKKDGCGGSCPSGAVAAADVSKS